MNVLYYGIWLQVFLYTSLFNLTAKCKPCSLERHPDIQYIDLMFLVDVLLFTKSVSLLT